NGAVAQADARAAAPSSLCRAIGLCRTHAAADATRTCRADRLVRRHGRRDICRALDRTRPRSRAVLSAASPAVEPGRIPHNELRSGDDAVAACARLSPVVAAAA